MKTKNTFQKAGICIRVVAALALLIFSSAGNESGIIVRYNFAGYLPDDPKEMLILSKQPFTGRYVLAEVATGEEILRGSLQKVKLKGWGAYSYARKADISALNKPGKYLLSIFHGSKKVASVPVITGNYPAWQEYLLAFMRQQRCGYNPFLDEACHKKDGRSFYSPFTDSTYIDLSGGWHDAGDQLKYLMTSSNATARMLLAYELEPGKFGDYVNALGQPYPNGIPDILDEARWGLEWMHKMHPAPGQLYHQVADDRDHVGWKLPENDPSDYGWGPNSYRAAYFATGKPQGLGKYKSRATGIANLAGRSAAAMAMGARIWEKSDTAFSQRCREAAIDLYRMGKEKEGYQQGNSYGAPYRYNEETWADDMEWGAAELYKLTGKTSYLEDAKHYASMINTTSWMMKDSAAHYQYYPFTNIGHFSLYPLVDEDFKDRLANWYRSGIERCSRKAKSNIYGIGIPFIWCSNNLATALITQIILYEKMTGDRQYHKLMTDHRDWLLGKNPWGTSMFTGLPDHAEYPVDVHTSIYVMTHREASGGLVDGPIWRTIHNKLTGLTLTEEDEFKDFQNDYIVYHDDIGDFSTNEPTMDGTADAIFMMAFFSGSN